MPLAQPPHTRCCEVSVIGQAGSASLRSAAKTRHPKLSRQRHSLRSPCHVQPHLTPPPCQWQHALPSSRSPHLSVCSAGAAAGTLSSSASKDSSPNSSSSSLTTRFWDWWSLGPTEENSKNTQSLQSIARKLWRMLRVNRWLLLGAFSFMMISALSELAIPHFTSASIFAAAEAKQRHVFDRNLKHLLAVSISYGVCAGLRGFFFSLLNTELIQTLRAELFRAIVQREVSFFDNAEVGVLTSRLGADCQAVVRCLSTNINVAARNSMQCVGGAIYLAILSWQLALSCLCMTTLLWAVALRFGSYSRASNRAYMAELANTNQVAQEVFLLSRVVRTFGSEEREAGRYSAQLGILRHISIRQCASYLLYLATNASLFHITKVMALLLGGWMALRGEISGQQLTSFVLYTEFVMSASLSVCDQWGGVMEAIGASERVIEYLDHPPAPQIQPGTVPSSFSGQVKLQDVEFAYPTRESQPALQGVSLELQPGCLVALVGLSGSGKSTLVALLQRLYDPTHGKVLVDGQDLRSLDASWYRAQIGVVDQDPRLFAESISANICYNCPGTASQEQIETAAKLANAHDFISTLPDGYSTVVTDKLLSGGQRQRIALARALVRDPKVLILDEATSALDAESEAAVAAALDKAMRTSGRAVLVIAHRLSTVRKADHIVVMQQGKVEEEGTHEELVLAGGMYSSLVRRQQSGSMLSQEDPPPLASQSFDEPFEDESPHTSSRSRPFPELDDLHMGDEERAARQGSSPNSSSKSSTDEDWWPMGRKSWQSSESSRPPEPARS